MFIDPLKRTLLSLWLHTFVTRMAGLFLLVIIPLLASCATTSPLDLGIPAQALESPNVGPLPDSTKLHVAITFKVNQDIIDTLYGQPIQPGQHSKLEQFASKIGIDDATYQKIKDFFNLKGIALNLSKIRTHLTIDAKASTFAKLFQTHFVIHKNLPFA
ncbi:MAG: protease pro-enzyme activation domain-containing protein, partial [Ktedonobacteraceae bacterium]